MVSNGKLKTKLIAIIIAVILAIIMSVVSAWVILQIYTKQPENLLNISISQILTVFSIEEGVQIFFLILLMFMLLLVLSIFKMFNLDDYLSKTYAVTKEIRIPLPVGKNQTQQGSSWWLSKKKFDTIFGVNTFDPQNPTTNHLLKHAEEQRKKEEYLMKHEDKIVPKEMQKPQKTVDPIYKKGRTCCW